MSHVENAVNCLEESEYFDGLLNTTETVDGIAVTYDDGDIEGAKAVFEVIRNHEAAGAKIAAEVPVKCAIAGVLVEGTSDFVCEYPDALVIVDYKNGAVPVYAKDNPQLSCYLLGAIADRGPKSKYALEIVQPQSFDRSALHTIWTFDESEVSKIEARFKRAVELIKATAQYLHDTGEIPRGAYAPGEHCKYCPIKTTCPGRVNAAISAACLSGLPYEEFARLQFLLDNAETIKGVIKGAEEYADDALLAGKKIYGWTLLESSANRAVKKDLTDGDIATLRSAGLVEDVPKLPTLAQLDKAEKKGVLKDAKKFVLDGKKSPKRVKWDADGTEWRSVDEFETAELAATEE
jgi:hypothetical protein